MIYDLLSPRRSSPMIIAAASQNEVSASTSTIMAVSDFDIATAAQSLMDLYSEEERCSFSCSKKKKIDEPRCRSGEDSSISDCSISSSMIVDESFGIGEEEKDNGKAGKQTRSKRIKRDAPAPRRTKYKSLKNIYEITTRMNINR